MECRPPPVSQPVKAGSRVGADRGQVRQVRETRFPWRTGCRRRLVGGGWGGVERQGLVRRPADGGSTGSGGWSVLYLPTHSASLLASRIYHIISAQSGLQSTLPTRLKMITANGLEVGRLES